MQVIPITKKQAEEFVVAKHYSHRASIFWAGFGLVVDGMIEGVVVYGQPSPPVQRFAFEGRDFRFYELSRLVVQGGGGNAASFLIGSSLKMLDSPCAVVSYADSEMGHSGIVYQATNWLYTGATVSHDHMYLIDGVRTHPMTLTTRGITNPKQWAKDNNIETVKPLPKHRYFYLVGNKREKRRMRSLLKYPVVPDYPKSDKQMYDAGDRIEMQAPVTQGGLL